MSQINLNKVWASTGVVTDPGDVKYGTGWVAEIPTYQEFNFLLNSMDSNIQELAKNGVFEWQGDIAYGSSATTIKGGIEYFASRANSNLDPDTDVTKAWGKAPMYGNHPADSSSLVTSGLYLFTVGTDNLAAWESHGLTIQEGTPLLFLKSSNVATKNFLLGSVDSKVCVVDVGTVAVPDGRALSLAGNDVHPIFHEGNLPNITQVVNGVEEAPTDGYAYARQNSGWLDVSASTFASGTAMVFLQAAAPAGWTKSTATNDRMMRITSATGGGTGGSDNPVLYSHDHGGGTGISTDFIHEGVSTFSGTGSWSHKHTVPSDTFTPKYVDVIHCTKN